jgi:hypothetical protein
MMIVALRLCVVFGPVVLMVASLVSRRRGRLVPLVVFGLGCAAIAGRALWRHDPGQHENWFLLAFPTVLVLPPLLVWEAVHLARSVTSERRMRTADDRWLAISLAVGIGGVYASWLTVSGGIP